MKKDDYTGELHSAHFCIHSRKNQGEEKKLVAAHHDAGKRGLEKCRDTVPLKGQYREMVFCLNPSQIV
jgi:hypothetical protein